MCLFWNFTILYYYVDLLYFFSDSGNPLYLFWNQYVFLSLVIFKISPFVWFSSIIYDPIFSVFILLSESILVWEFVNHCFYVHTILFLLFFWKESHYMYDKSYCISFVSYPFFIFFNSFFIWLFLDIYFKSIFQIPYSLYPLISFTVSNFGDCTFQF